MRNASFNFIDENFGEKVECVLIWDDNSFILITLMENKIKIKEYEEITDLFKDVITSKNELEFLRNVTAEQDKEIEELEDKIKWLKLKRKQ
ncbi:MAG: hypothetical protein J6J60_00565 [Clostridia bacterium]|nr:hypothetical protein [Clostridia bacterium]